MANNYEACECECVSLCVTPAFIADVISSSSSQSFVLCVGSEFILCVNIV